MYNHRIVLPEKYTCSLLDFSKEIYYNTGKVRTEKEDVDIRTLESCFDKFSLNHSIIYARIRIDKEVYWNDSTSQKHAQKYHPELPDIKTIGREPMIKVDTEQFPGHSHHYDGIYFGCCYEMWFGKDYDK